MYTQETISGHECNLIIGISGSIRGITILVGPADRPGWRRKDGARELRAAVRNAVISALHDEPRAHWILERPKNIKVSARYSCMAPSESGLLVRYDDNGRPIGTYAP